MVKDFSEFFKSLDDTKFVACAHFLPELKKKRGSNRVCASSDVVNLNEINRLLRRCTAHQHDCDTTRLSKKYAEFQKRQSDTVLIERRTSFTYTLIRPHHLYTFIGLPQLLSQVI